MEVELKYAGIKMASRGSSVVSWSQLRFWPENNDLARRYFFNCERDVFLVLCRQALFLSSSSFVPCFPQPAFLYRDGFIHYYSVKVLLFISYCVKKCDSILMKVVPMHPLYVSMSFLSYPKSGNWSNVFSLLLRPIGIYSMWSNKDLFGISMHCSKRKCVKVWTCFTYR